MVAAASAQITSGTFSALTFNVAGIASLLQGNNVGDQSNIARKIGSLFAKKKFDIIHLQEVNMHFLYQALSADITTRTSITMTTSMQRIIIPGVL